MDDKKKYKDLEERCRKLENELSELRLKGHGAAKSSSEMVNYVFHSASQAIAISKLDTGEFVDVNQSFLSILGYSREEVIGKNADDLKLFTDINKISKDITKKVHISSKNESFPKLQKLNESPNYVWSINPKFIDEDKLHMRIKENQKKPVVKSAFQKRLEEMSKVQPRKK